MKIWNVLWIVLLMISSCGVERDQKDTSGTDAYGIENLETLILFWEGISSVQKRTGATSSNKLIK